MLAQAGRRLRGLVPAHDTVARWGGDEFAVLIESAASPQEIVDIAERLAGAIAAEPFQVAGRDISITASVGVAFADPEVAEHLLRNADLAMSRAKDAGGGRVEVFAAHMHADVIRRLELATDLRAAIEEGRPRHRVPAGGGAVDVAGGQRRGAGPLVAGRRESSSRPSSSGSPRIPG